VVRENGEIISERPVEFGADKTRFTETIALRGPGVYEYTASIIPDREDKWVQNNTASGYVHLRGEGRTLIVYDPAGNPADYGTLERALQVGRFSVDSMAASRFPGATVQLLPYACIIFVNVPVESFDSVQLLAVHDVVYNVGIGFIMVGGLNSFSPGDYHRTVVEKVLPVRMDIKQRKVMPKGALAVHTCEFARGNTIAKRVTKQALVRAARVRALSQGRVHVSFGDVRHYVREVLQHRVLLNYDGQAEDVSVPELIDRLVEKLDEEVVRAH
jgi:hypothetical protein